MFGRSKRTRRDAVPIAVAALLLACHAAHAEYWVSIGAYRAAETAQKLAAEANDKAALSFSVRAADTAEGSIYRVVAGPFASRRDAQTGAVQIRDAGFADGWIVGLDGASPPSTAATLDPLIDSAADTGIDTDFPDISLDEWSLDDDLPPIEVLLRGLPDMPTVEPAPARASPASEPAPETVVPENYRLNRLHRDARLRPRPDDEEAGSLAAFDARMKWYTSARSLPSDDALRQRSGDSTPLDHNADLRLLWRPQFGAVKLHVDHSTIWRRTDAVARSPGLTFDQTPTGDGRRLMDLTWGDTEPDDSGNQRLHRLDRFAAEYRTNRWGVTVGRQALSWGSGMVFQPMDLFNPFSPTTVDQDYKAGDDMILVEHLFPDGSDLQVLAVVRRESPMGMQRGDVTWDASSVAAKFRAVMGDNELEVMVAGHHNEQIVATGMRIPLGGALLRSDLVWTRSNGRMHISGVVNADYTFGIAGSPVHVFGEYFHNGFGVSELPGDLAQLPTALLERVAIRGELFNLMRNYIAAGASFRWHFLLNQSLAVIANLHDSSSVAQTSLSYDSGDASRLQVGLAVPLGSTGDEFGTLAVGDDLTIGGGEQGFLRFVHYF